ncbi:MAG: GNAT family N-acetyltransferase [Gammaproteobacteria bacterium]|nr:GNAT family N-acetyltransferase [Gammaproteobacteria bacterium]
MKLSTVDSLSTVDAAQWNALVNASAADDNPFIQYDFLRALEQHDCLLNWGWQPQHILLHENDRLIGACPAYLKFNSYGEFVFDWAWADAYQRNNLDYYPKLVISIPFTPAKGSRLLALNNDKNIKAQLIQGVLELVEVNKLSGAHWLFCEEDDIAALQKENMMLRFDYQFHWQNRNYASFDDFLATMSSKKRKNIKRERRRVSDENIQVIIKDGTELSEEEWQTLYHFYQITFMKKSGTATLSLAFFQAMAHKLVTIFARHENRIVAGAICFRGGNTLYGRHWGCYEDYDSLHFEVCYYTGIEYCIEHKLQYFEPGAQGEHKISRGFLPVQTRSAHHLAHEGFRGAIADFLQREQQALLEYGQTLHEASPFKKA